MSTVSTRTKKAWEDNQKKKALSMMETLITLLKKDKIKVVSYEFWANDDNGDATFVLKTSDNS